MFLSVSVYITSVSKSVRGIGEFYTAFYFFYCLSIYLLNSIFY